ncbi:MAG: prolipoprotein diacylglyceryl transferase [Ignavibacteriales bacterium]|nr:prolipoprotein diacylglyceryl transferase [Ignavibacteriales bacterium]
MYPKILELGPFTIYSFGFMMAVSFLIGNALLTKELKRKKINPDFGATITMIALVAGITGSKILYLIENWEETFADPIGSIFSPAGLTFYGGFVLAAVSIYWYMKRKGITFLRIADAVAPALLLAYGIARIGCHLAGDGDYGTPTRLPWGTIYANAIVKPHSALREYFYAHPTEAQEYQYGLSEQVVGRDQFGTITVFDQTVTLHPAPIYELLICAFFFAILWKYRRRMVVDGTMFYWYLIAAGIERFSVEFLRLNPTLFLGLSEAQLISFVLIIAGIVALRTQQKDTAPHA